jgi:predicted flap endonuclease-1-like 5' DNA nuclease
VTGGQTIALPHVSGPANAALAEAGITSLNELATLTERQIADLHGMGPKGIRILKAALADHGLAFAERSPSTT